METEVYTQVVRTVKKILNIDLTYYKDEQMKRRLDSWLVRNNAPTWEFYFHFVSNNPVELLRFRNYLTINVTEFFRDPDRWQALRTQIVPYLLRDEQNRPRSGCLKVWSAGCSIGIEAYTLSILLSETVRGMSYAITATDIDRGALDQARARGPYRAEEVRTLAPEMRAKYLDEREKGFFAKESLQKTITFAEQDLNADRFGTSFDLIVCRNVIIYFTNEAKSVLYRKFNAALRPGGVLFLGGTEIIPTPKEIGFRSVATSFYVKDV